MRAHLVEKPAEDPCAGQGSPQAQEKADGREAHPLPEELARTCQAILGERINALRLWALGAAEIAPYQWQDRNRRLFDAAAQVQKARAKARP